MHTQLETSLVYRQSQRQVEGFRRYWDVVERESRQMHESNQPECTTGAFSVDGSEDKFGGRNGCQYWVILFVDLKVFLEDLQGQVYVRTEADKSNRDISEISLVFRLSG